MDSLLGALLNLLRILRSSTKDRIKRLLRSRWATLLAYLTCKLSEWRSWLRNPGTHRKPKPADPSFPGGRGGTCSVSCSSARGHAARVAASTIPASANAANRPHRELEGAERWPVEPETVLPLSSIQDTLPVPPPNLDGEIQWPGIGENGPTDHRSRSPSIRSAGDKPSISRTSSRTSSQNDRPSRDPSLRATPRQFGLGPGAQSSRRSSKSPSPQPSLNTAQPYHLNPVPTSTNIHPHADGMSPPISPQNLTGFLSPMQGQLSPPASRRGTQRTTSTGRNIQNPSTDSLPNTPIIYAQEITEEPMAMDTSPHSSLHALPSDRAETASQNSHTASSAASVFVLPEDRYVQLIISEQIPRYTKNATISREGNLQSVKRLTTIFLHFPDPNAPDHPSLMGDCSPWIPATHPDGALYFYDPERRLFTDTDMHDHTLREEIEDFYYYLKKIERDELLTIPSKNYDMVLDLALDGDNKMQWSYYYACHDARCLFWLEEYDITYITSELDGVESPAHLKHRLEDLYWNHWSLFPVVFEGRCLPLSVYDELMGILVHGCIDVMTSRLSTLPYDDDQMQKMITLVQKAKEAQSDIGSMIGVNIAGGVGGISDVSAVSNAGGMEHYTAATTRLLSFFAHWRFLYFHGQRHARLVCDQTAYDTSKRKRSALVTLLSPLLFFAPEVHLMEMDKLWADELIIHRAWKGFMTKTIIEWNDLILWSTVMLALNVGFLSIPGIVPNSAPNGTLSIPRQMTILSSLVSIGSILIGLVLVRYNRTKQDLDPAKAWEYLFQNSRKYFGLELMAIVFSLPWALLIWSMLLFIGAVIPYSWSISNLWSRFVVASILVFVFSLFVGCMWTTWESSGGSGVRLHGLCRPIFHALRASHVMIARLRDGIMSFRNRFHTVTTDNGRERELAGQRNGVISGTV